MSRRRRAALLLDAAFMGLHLDLSLDRDDPDVTRAVADVAAAVDGLARS
jgi:hypothetical protein